jgi:hypothetical protein
MKRLVAVFVVSLATGCAEETPTGEQCQTVAADSCEAEGCAGAVTYRQITAEAPQIDDDCFGEPFDMCIDDLAATPADAKCVFIYRPDGDGTVLRPGTTTLPAGWLPCTGEDGEPPGCACADVGACGR